MKLMRTTSATLAVALVGLSLGGCLGTGSQPLTSAEKAQIKGGPRPANLDIGKAMQDSKDAWNKAHPNAASSPAAGGSGAPTSAPSGG